MKKISSIILVLFFGAICFNCSESKNENPPLINPNSSSVETETAEMNLVDVVYGNDNEQVFDLYLPENRTENTKVIILIHGGGWSTGDKSSMNAYKTIAKQDLPGYAVANMNYRLASQGVSPFPMQLEDISLLVNHLKNEQSNYNISDQIAFVGVSAGAHLAMLWSYNYDTNNQVNMVGSIVGPTDLNDSNYQNNPDFPVNDILTFFGATPTQEFLETYSPYHNVTTTSPPTILFYGGNDTLIPTSQGVNLDARLTELGVTHEFTLYPNEGHGWIGPNLFDTWTKLKGYIITHH